MTKTARRDKCKIPQSNRYKKTEMKPKNASLTKKVAVAKKRAIGRGLQLPNNYGNTSPAGAINATSQVETKDHIRHRLVVMTINVDSLPSI